MKSIRTSVKRVLVAYGTFSRLEALGLAALSIVLFVLFVTWQTMDWWYPRQSEDKADQQKLASAYRDFMLHNKAGEQAIETGKEEDATAVLFSFDPNTLDSAGFRQLGMSARVVKGLMSWRRHGKVFYKKEDLKPLYNLSAAEYDRLEPYISINGGVREKPRAYSNTYTKPAPLPATLDLNTTDSATLVRLNGIGPTLAHKIIERRRLLGGYLRHEQLMEIYKFSDSTLTMLRQRLAIRPEEVKKIPVNKASLAQLQTHPYIGEKTAKNIVLYRDALGKFDNIAQLKQVPLMNEENYRKIAPYLSIE